MSLEQALERNTEMMADLIRALEGFQPAAAAPQEAPPIPKLRPKADTPITPEEKPSAATVTTTLIPAATDTIEYAQVAAAIASSAPYVLIAVPLLVEGGRWQGRYDRILVVDCPTEVQIERVMQRSQLERTQVEAIMAAQATREQRLAAATDVIDNGGAAQALPGQVDAIDSLYRRLSLQNE